MIRRLTRHGAQVAAQVAARTWAGPHSVGAAEAVFKKLAANLGVHVHSGTDGW
jgi:hypothetical protein